MVLCVIWKECFKGFDSVTERLSSSNFYRFYFLEPLYVILVALTTSNRVLRTFILKLEPTGAISNQGICKNSLIVFW